MKTKHDVLLHSFLGKAQYDAEGKLIWGVQATGHHQRLMDLRGWGNIQSLFTDHQEAVAFEKHLGHWVAEAINEKLQRDSEFLLYTPEFYSGLSKRMLKEAKPTMDENSQLHQELLEGYLKIFYTKHGPEKENAIQEMCALLRVSRVLLNKMMFNPL